MTVDQIVAKLDTYGFTDVATADKIDFINDVIWDIAGRYRWPFMEKSLTLVFDGAAAAPTNWPADVVAVKSIVDTKNATTLKYIRFEELRERYATNLTDEALPYLYYFIADKLEVYPIPSADSAQTLKMLYEYWPAAVAAGGAETTIIIPKRFHSVVWFGALAQLYDLNEDIEMALKWERRYEKKIQDIVSQLWFRQTDSADTIEIIDSEDIYT